MTYICHTPFNGNAANCKPVDIKRGDVLQLDGSMLYFKDIPVCTPTSYIGHRYFARNDDGQGLKRGELTSCLAYAPRGQEYRFSDDEIQILLKEYPHFLKKADTILFNHEFFNASIEELEELANALAIKFKED